MAKLTNDQLLLFDQFNRSRLKLLEIFKNKSQLDPGPFFEEFLKLEVLAMEHKHREKLDPFLREN